MTKASTNGGLNPVQNVEIKRNTLSWWWLGRWRLISFFKSLLLVHLIARHVLSRCLGNFFQNLWPQLGRIKLWVKFLRPFYHLDLSKVPPICLKALVVLGEIEVGNVFLHLLLPSCFSLYPGLFSIIDIVLYLSLQKSLESLNPSSSRLAFSKALEVSFWWLLEVSTFLVSETASDWDLWASFFRASIFGLYFL